MNAQHKENRRQNRVRRIQNRLAALAELAKSAAASPVTLANCESEMARVRRNLEQYSAA